MSGNVTPVFSRDQKSKENGCGRNTDQNRKQHEVTIKPMCHVCWVQFWSSVWKSRKKNWKRAEQSTKEHKCSRIQQQLKGLGRLTWTDTAVLEVYKILSSLEKTNWDLLPVASCNKRSWGHEKSNQMEVQHQVKEILL